MISIYYEVFVNGINTWIDIYDRFEKEIPTSSLGF